MTSKPIVKLLWGVVFTLVVAAPASADILLIEQVRERMLRDLPDNGLTMNEVESRYGDPRRRHSAVGNPPITRWDFEDYSVYFEHEIVIESVLHNEAVTHQARKSPD